jgi:hypothetical protein
VPHVQAVVDESRALIINQCGTAPLRTLEQAGVDNVILVAYSDEVLPSNVALGGLGGGVNWALRHVTATGGVFAACVQPEQPDTSCSTLSTRSKSRILILTILLSLVNLNLCTTKLYRLLKQLRETEVSTLPKPRQLARLAHKRAALAGL